LQRKGSILVISMGARRKMGTDGADGSVIATSKLQVLPYKSDHGGSLVRAHTAPYLTNFSTEGLRAYGRQFGGSSKFQVLKLYFSRSNYLQNTTGQKLLFSLSPLRYPLSVNSRPTVIDKN
jgi:hypothetical protein